MVFVAAERKLIRREVADFYKKRRQERSNTLSPLTAKRRQKVDRESRGSRS